MYGCADFHYNIKPNTFNINLLFTSPDKELAKIEINELAKYLVQRFPNNNFNIT